jgi:hypothetical protein
MPCPFIATDTLDPYAWPTFLTIGTPLLVFAIGALFRNKAGALTYAHEQVFHGLWMFATSLAGGLAIPNVYRGRAMLSFHQVGCLQAVFLLSFLNQQFVRCRCGVPSLERCL